MKSFGGVRLWGALGIASLVLIAACDDEFGPSHWEAVPDTVELYSWSRAEYQGMPSGFDMLGTGGRHGQKVEVENRRDQGSWDFAFRELDGRFVLMPAGALKGFGSDAGIGELPGVDFESVTEVPRTPSRYTDSTAVAIEPGQVYALRSRTFYLYGSQRCVFYGKLSPISFDEVDGILRFEVVRNPNCNDRSMVPPKKK